MARLREFVADEVTRPAERAVDLAGSSGERCTGEQRLQLLAEANALLLSNADAKAVVQMVAERVMQLLGFDISVNYVLDEGSLRLRLNAQAGLSDEVAASIMWLDLGEAVCGCVACDGKRIVAEDIQHSDDARADLVRSLGLQAYVCDPLRVGDRTVGTLSFGTRKSRHISDEDLELVRIVADQVSVALERAHALGAMREREAAQAFLLRLSDALRMVGDPHTAMNLAARMLGEFLGLNRVTYAEVQGDETIVRGAYANGVAPLPARSSRELLGRGMYESGAPVVVDDVAHDERLSDWERATLREQQIGAFIGMGVVKSGTVAAIFAVHSVTPRHWTQQELWLLDQVAERTWAAVTSARSEEALRISESKYRTLFESMDEGYCIIEVLFDENGEPMDYRFLEANPAFVRQTGMHDVVGKTMRSIAPNHEEHWFQRYGRVVLTGEPDRFEEVAEALGRHYDVYAFPVGDPPERRVAVLFNDVSERRCALVALQESEQRFRAVLEDSLDAAYRRDLVHDRYEYVSPRIESIVGFTPEQFAEMPMADAMARIHPDDRASIESAVRRAYETGRLTVEYRMRHKDGRYVWLADYATLVTDDAGTPLYLSGVVRDVTESRRVAEELRHVQERQDVLLRQNLDRAMLLKDLANAVASSLDPGELSHRVAVVCRNLLRADAVAVYLTHDGAATVAAKAGGEWPCMPSVVREERATPGGRAMSLRAVQVESEMPVPEACEPEAEGCTIVWAPILVRRDVSGVVAFGFSRVLHLKHDELDLFRAVGDQLAVGLENARLYAAEHGIAETLQETLVVLPAEIPGITYSRAYESATAEIGRVGGDFVDIFELGDGTVAVALGDVSGKGIEAAVTTSLIRNTMRVHTLDGLSPGHAVGKANDVLRRFTEVDSFVTLWFGLLDIASGHIRYVCAGHPPAIVLSADGSMRVFEHRDPMLGAFEGPQYFEYQTFLAPGDRLVLYSDGITEARSPNGRFLGETGLHRMLADNADVSARELAPLLLEEVLAFSNGALRDDAAALVVALAEPRR